MTLAKVGSTSSQALEHPAGDGGVGLGQVPLDAVAQPGRVVVVGLLDVDHLEVDPAEEPAVLVEHVGDAAGHAGAEVAAGAAEHDDPPAGHVLAAVVADALDHRDRARVAHAEALADDAADEDLAAGRAVEHDVAGDDVLLGDEGRRRRAAAR